MWLSSRSLYRLIFLAYMAPHVFLSIFHPRDRVPNLSHNENILWRAYSSNIYAACFICIQMLQFMTKYVFFNIFLEIDYQLWGWMVALDVHNMCPNLNLVLQSPGLDGFESYQYSTMFHYQKMVSWVKNSGGITTSHWLAFMRVSETCADWCTCSWGNKITEPQCYQTPNISLCRSSHKSLAPQC